MVPYGSFSCWCQTIRALRRRNFRPFVSGQAISLVDLILRHVAQGWLVYRLTRSEWLLGGTLFCSQFPVFVLGPLGGTLADRYSRHRIVIAKQMLSMVQALALAALTLTSRVQVWHVMVPATMLGVVNAFDTPARHSLLIQMTGKEDLLSAIALNSAMFNSARTLGPAMAGVLVAAAGEGVCFLLNGISFLAVIGSLLAMQLPPFAPSAIEAPWQRLVDGFRYARRTPAICTPLAIVAAVSFSSMPAVVLLPVFAGEIFHRGSEGLGFLMAAMGAGTVIGTLVLARSSPTAGLYRAIYYGAAGLGVAFTLFGASASFYVALAAASLIGYSATRTNTSANTLIQTLIPDEYRGRIMALYAVTVVGIGPFGQPGSGRAGRFDRSAPDGCLRRSAVSLGGAVSGKRLALSQRGETG